jgi:parallel beta-helix repeat protein
VRLALFALLLACAPTEPETPMNRYTVAAVTVAGLWSATGGTISPTGRYVAADTGLHWVAYDSAGLHDTATVNVCAFAGLEVTPDSAVMAVGDTAQVNGALETNCLTADTSITVFWESRDEAVATVVATGTQRGRITAVAAGTTWVIGRDSLSTRFDSVYVCVEDYYSTDVTPATLALETVGTTTGGLTATLTNCGASDPAVVSWVSRNTGVATVASTGDQTATVTAVAIGSTWVVSTKAPGGADSTQVSVGGACTPSATTLAAGDSIQAKVNAQPSGTAFTLCAGIFRMQSVTPKSGMSFTGAGPTLTILTGAKQLTAWTAAGSWWYASGQTQGAFHKSGFQCDATHPLCYESEQLWINDSLYIRVASTAALGAGKWFFDEAADRIYIAENPSGKVIETSVSPWAFAGNATGVSITGLGVTRYANSNGYGAIGYQTSGANWTVTSVHAYENHGVGIKGSSGWDVIGSNMYENGQMGYSVTGTGVLFYRDTMAYNNTNGNTAGVAGEAGGGKMSHSTSSILRRNYAHHNKGPGLWVDINNYLITLDSNTVDANEWRGIFYEISYDAVIAYNTVTNNGFALPFATPSACDGAGILVSNSPNVEVHHNTLSGNFHGIVGREEDRGSGNRGALNVTDLDVHDNTVSQTRASSRMAGICDSDPTADPTSGGANNVWSNNTYTCTSTTKFRWTGNLDVTRGVWDNTQDAGSSFTGC